MTPVIAIISPNANAYSETFIQAHRNLKGTIFFYSGGSIPSFVNNIPLTEFKSNNFMKVIDKIKRRLSEIIPSKFLFTKDKRFFIKSLTENKINIVYAEYGPTGVAVMNVCKHLNLPLIVNFHGYDISITNTLKKYKNEYIKMFDYASKIIVVSKFMYERILSLGAETSKVYYTVYGPNDVFLNTKSDFEELSLLAVGRFVEKKAPDKTIQAFNMILSEFPDAKLYMAGTGPLLEKCKLFVKQLNIEKNVLFLGVLSPTEIASYYKKVRGFVQHSVTAGDGDMEGTPVAVLEASAAGLPVISTYHAGIPDVVIDEETGLLVEEHDIEGMAKNMQRILENINLAKTLGENGKNRIRNNFTMNHHLNKLNEVINIVLQQSIH